MFSTYLKIQIFLLKSNFKFGSHEKHTLLYKAQGSTPYVKLLNSWKQVKNIARMLGNISKDVGIIT